MAEAETSLVGGLPGGAIGRLRHLFPVQDGALADVPEHPDSIPG